MRLPSKLLGCMRVGVGVGAVMLGGCDLVEEAKARVLDEEDAVAEQAVAEPTAAAPVAAPAAPEPLLLGRSGVAGVVDEAVARSKATEGFVPAPIEASRPAPIEDLGRPSTAPTREPEGTRSFVPYDDGRGTTTAAPLAPKPRPRKPRAVRPVDEPCDPALATVAPPEGEWQCPACGRG